jgi:sulfur transfer complex TusBCD TusB component (DsrH family)
MGDNGETGKGGKDKTTEIIAQSINEANQLVQSSITDDKKKEAGKSVNRELKEAKSRLQTIIEAIKGQPQLNKIMILKDDHDAQNALRTLAKAVEIVRIEKTQTGKPGIISSQIAIAPQGLPVLEKLAEQSLNIPTAAAIEYFFGDFIFGDKEIIHAGQITQEAVEAFKRLADFDSVAAEKIKTAIKKAVEEGAITGFQGEVALQEIEKKFKNPKELSSEGELSQFERKDVTFQRIYERLEPEEKQFFAAVISGSKEFINYVRKIREEIIENNPGMPSPEIDELVSVYLEERVQGILYQIYAPELSIKDTFIDEKERRGVWWGNIEGLVHTFRDSLVSLSVSLKNVDGKDLGKFLVPKRERRQIYDEKRGAYVEEEEVTLPTREAKSLEEFIKHLYGYVLEGERARLRYGYNVDYIVSNPTIVDPQKGLFGTLAGFARGIKSHQIDEIFARRDEMISTALRLMEESQNIEFLFSAWKKDPVNLTEYVTSFRNLEIKLIDFLKKNFPSAKSWEINRAIFNAKLIFHGVLLSSFMKYSYANAPQTPGAELTYVGPGSFGLAPFDVASLAKRFLSDSLTCGKADFMPINWAPYFYDHKIAEKFKKAYGQTFQKGRAAYYDLVGDDFLDIKLIIEAGNITKSGGLFELSGWRAINAYDFWLRDFITYERKIIYEAGKENYLLKAWQAVENIGIDVLENFIVTFVTKEVEGLGKGKALSPLIDKEKINGLRIFFGYLYDRYLDTEMGKALIRKKDGSVMTKDEWLEEAMRGFLDKELTKEEKMGLIKKKIYEALTVMMWERLPLNFVTLEKINLTQNGVTVAGELRRFLTQQGIQNPDQFLKQALDDLVLAQILLRGKVSGDMLRIYKEKGNLFGDLGSLRSEVNNGRGYVLDESVIRELLQQQLGDKERERIERAILIYQKIKEILISPLRKASWEENDPNYEKRAKLYMSPFKYFNRLYTNGEFGFSITNSEIDFKFLNLSATGPETLFRMMSYDADTAEATHSLWNKFYDDAVYKLIAARGDVTKSQFYDTLRNLHVKIRSQTGEGDIPNDVIKTFLLRVAWYIKKDDQRIPLLQDAIDWAIRRPSSLVEEKIKPDSGFLYEADKNDLIKLFRSFAGDAGEPLIPRFSSEPKMKEVPVERYGLWGKIYKRFTGKDTIRVRDINKELSAVGLEHLFGSGVVRFAYEYVLPRVIIALILLALALAWLAGKKDLKVGSEK